MKRITYILSIFLVFLFLVTGCSQKNLDDYLTGDIYRQVPKEVHDKEYPHGHEDVTGKNCTYDYALHKYYCQYPFYDD